MKSIILVVVAIAALTAGLPMPDPQASLVPGVFISADTFKRLQEQANANRQNQPEVRSPETVQTGQIIAVNQPGIQPLLSNQQTVPNQVPATNEIQSQSILTNQASSNQPIYLLQQQPAQSVVVQPQKQLTNMVVSTSNQSGQPLNSNGNVYALVPLNTPNQNTNSGNTYLIPIPSGSSNPIILKSSTTS